MARVSMRELLRLRSSFLSHPTPIPSKPNLSISSPYTSFPSSEFTFDKRRSIPSHQTLNLFETCYNQRQLYQIQAQLISSGLFQNPSLAGRVLRYSTQFGSIDYTILIFRCIESPDAFCVNTVIKAYACSGVPHQAVVLYFEMLRNGFFPNSFTFPPLISSCAKMGCSKSGRKCHGQAVKNGVDGVLPVQNSLIHLYACCGLIDVAWQVFEEMPDRDLVSWNSIIDGFAKFGNMDAAHKLFDVMSKKNMISWNVMITGYLNAGNPGCGLKLFREMVKTGLRGSDTTIVSLLTACGRSARLKEGRSVHGSFIRTIFSSSLIIDTALINMYSKCGRLDVARIIFDRMLVRNLVCWNAMILGHCIHGNPKDGLDLYAEIVGIARLEDGEINFDKNIKREQGQRIIPDEITFIGVLCACARAGLLMEGRKHFSEMIDTFRIKANFAHCWCMANLFVGVGLMQEAEEVLRNVPIDDVSADSSLWAGLLGSCRFQGNVLLGERIAKALIELEPHNFFCYALLLNVYAAAGQWEHVARMKEMMKETGVRRMPGCSLVDLKEIVHDFKMGDKCRLGMQEAEMMAGELAQRFGF
ncbi:pentatricopeptide repeat-containing protein At3g51320 [Cornus florida]|uniref:pentatricopeptide repeat-containing protein At3g51320 n=1 Tax=Cornus florida TaxID=4283 RepID=UPI0028A0E8E8|nr:pentatricopeptide repeat-containing protein At3g51320 [Cornus florida]XP_059623440.1 pentatricopeptide repeat-containing protein At3g51320 [Cornus florida]XP_059623441.1 pentatricopeptide repeat-containing protein At3g51320 [Cornus florida]